MTTTVEVLEQARTALAEQIWTPLIGASLGEIEDALPQARAEAAVIEAAVAFRKHSSTTESWKRLFAALDALKETTADDLSGETA